MEMKSMTPPAVGVGRCGGSPQGCRGGSTHPLIHNAVSDFLTFGWQCETDHAGRKSAQVTKRANQPAGPAPWKLLLWTAVAGLVFGLIGFGEIAEDTLRVGRNSLHWHKASGDIVLVKIDDPSLREVGRWPWPRRYHAILVDHLTQAGAKRIFIDIGFFGVTDSVNDQALATSLKRSHRVVLAARTRAGPSNGEQQDAMPSRLLASSAQVGTISWEYNFQTAVSGVPYATSWHGEVIPSFAALLAGRSGAPDRTFIPDYSIDPDSIPTISARQVLAGTFDPRLVRGKQVLIGTASDGIGDQYFVPGTGKMGGAFVHVIAAETLKSVTPVYLGWLPLLLAALGACWLAASRRSAGAQAAALALTTIALLFGPALPEAYGITLDVTPALFVVIAIASTLGWQRYRVRGLVNSVSNLPNLNALRTSREGRRQSLVAARVLNFEEVLATLPPNSERELVEQIVGRLNVGSPAKVLFQGDAGIFAWFEQPRQPFGNHLEALHALFRNPVRVGGLSIDLSIAFGVEVGSGRSLGNRLASALVAADEAAHDGLKWKYHEPESLEDASWKLSMLSQLDEAIDRGEVWVAYQPKLDLASRQIIGAEALARWTHPDKGPIAASEFVAAAEQHNRIGKLTDFVLEKAVAAAAQINKRGADFDIAVNLSARLLEDKGFTLRLSALLARHALAPQHLTLELTETAALAGSGEGLDMITRLRDLGVNIAIDDYGTGLSTLEYLKKIPATEIKIDQSFVKGIADNRSDRLMVQSTIGLAHALDRKVVAEGVEHREVLELLIEMGCDIAQGFAIGRPMSLESLAKRIASDRKRSAA
jgi:EAL domain-containing protein (putative c-di-GMP-specific phosphodiesterase class I)/CHASE2 domain-containing sensor protein